VKLSPDLVLLHHVAVTMGHLVCRLLLADRLLGFLFKPEEGGSMYLRNFGGLIPDCTALYFRRQHS
jgi:hypothetical protein